MRNAECIIFIMRFGIYNLKVFLFVDFYIITNIYLRLFNKMTGNFNVFFVNFTLNIIFACVLRNELERT